MGSQCTLRMPALLVQRILSDESHLIAIYDSSKSNEMLSTVLERKISFILFCWFLWQKLILIQLIDFIN
jgi:hypothetical protein